MIKKEKEDGTLDCIEFHREEEDFANFKAAVRAWLQANQPMTWQQFFDKLVSLDQFRIRISLVGC